MIEPPSKGESAEVKSDAEGVVIMGGPAGISARGVVLPRAPGRDDSLEKEVKDLRAEMVELKQRMEKILEQIRKLED